MLKLIFFQTKQFNEAQLVEEIWSFASMGKWVEIKASE